MQHSCNDYNAFRSIPWQTCTYLRTWQHQMTTIKQPFQCNLQPEIQKPHRTTHTDTTTRCKTHRRNNSRMKRPQPHLRTHEVPFIAGCSHFTRKNARFRAPASSPTHHLPLSPLPFLTTPHRHHHVPSSPPPFVHFPSSPLPFLTTSHRPHLPSSPLPIVTTSLRHHPVP